jgi:outer membrane murein-binding lipoprotein Lpp
MTKEEVKRMMALESGQQKILSKLDSIYTEVKRTNGRVTKLEDEMNATELWQAKHEDVKRDVEDLKTSNNKRMGANVVLYFIAGVGGALAVAVLQYFLMK